MITIVKHGREYEDRQRLNEPHRYRCDCGCEFIASLASFKYSVVGHGEMDYTLPCPECKRTVYDLFHRVR